MGGVAYLPQVEKDAAFMRLAEDRFYNTHPCIIVTAKGQPDVATRWVKEAGQVLGLVLTDLNSAFGCCVVTYRPAVALLIPTMAAGSS
jgi:hypothetical protein